VNPFSIFDGSTLLTTGFGFWLPSLFNPRPEGEGKGEGCESRLT